MAATDDEQSDRFLPIPRAHASGVAGLFRGARLLAVDYAYLEDEDGAEYRGGYPGFDADLRGVVLDLGTRGHHHITWATLGVVESLSIVREDPYVPSEPTVQASDRDPWRAHIGEQITSVGLSWFDDTPKAEAATWALRLDFPTGTVVIVLGGCDGVTSTIHPEADELVVISDTEVARDLRPFNTVASAWGLTVGGTMRRATD